MIEINVEKEAFIEHFVHDDGEEISTLQKMQAIVGGYIERALTLPNGDEIYVNEEGLFTQPCKWFAIPGHQPFAGNGVIVASDHLGDTISAVSSLSELRRKIHFFDQATVEVIASGMRIRRSLEDEDPMTYDKEPETNRER